MKLKRIKAGEYQTLDGRFTLLKDPTSGDDYLGWGYTSWLVYDEHEEDPELRSEPVIRGVGTLRDAKIDLAILLEEESTP